MHLPNFKDKLISKKRRQTLLLDFDGVIHSYTSGWQGIDVIPDPPVEGAREGIIALRAKFSVLVFSVRGNSSRGVAAMEKWLKENNIEVDGITSGTKPPSALFIDDRGYRFDGDWHKAVKFALGNIDSWIQ